MADDRDKLTVTGEDEKPDGRKQDGSGDQEGSRKKKTDRFCSVCHRPEEVTGPLVDLPTGISVCSDCMQKSLDMMKNSDLDLGKMLRNLPNVTAINFSDLRNLLQPGNREAEAEEEESAPLPSAMNDILPPHKIKAQLDQYVIGQEKAKKVLSVAVYNHYKRVLNEERRKEEKEKAEKVEIPDPNAPEPIEIEKSNVLLIGPTGCGKTYLVQTLARILDVPLALTDATTLTEAGYIGDDIESVLSKLLAAANNNVKRAEHGIVFIDEIDKIAKKKNTHHRDVSGEAVQQGLLRLLEGAPIEVPVGASSKNAMVPLKTVDTRNILFICGGAFPGLEDIILERRNRRASIGFHADLKESEKEKHNLLREVETEDLRNFGMIPEFLGRLPIVCALDELTEDMLVRILNEPRNAILRQYQELLAMDEVQLIFEEGALRAIARQALKKETGARALRAIIEGFITDIMYEIPKDDNIGTVVITEEYVENRGGPRIVLRGQSA